MLCCVFADGADEMKYKTGLCVCVFFYIKWLFDKEQMFSGGDGREMKISFVSQKVAIIETLYYSIVFFLYIYNTVL